MIAVSRDRRLAAAPRHPTRLGQSAALRRRRVGSRRAPRARTSRTGTGATTASSSTRSRSGSPRPWPSPSTLDLLARPGSLASGSTPACVVPPRPLRALRRRIAVLRRYRELLRLARREGFGPFLSSASRAGRSLDGAGVRAPARARGGRRRLHQARSDRGDAGRPPAARDLRPSSPSCRTGSRPRRSKHMRAGARSRARHRRREGLRRVRLGAARGGVDRPDVSGPTAHRRAGRRQGATARHRRRHGARPRRARAARRTSRSGAPRSARACGRASMLGQFAREPARGARLPARGRRDGGDGAAARRARRRSASRRCTASSVHAAAPRTGALRGLHARRHRRARSVRRSTASRSPSSCCARRSSRCSASASSTPTLIPGTSSRSTTERSASSTSAPSAGSTRSSRPPSSTCSPRSCAATSSCCRDGIERVADVTRGARRPNVSSARSPGLMADHVRADGRGRSVGVAGPRRDALRRSASACPASSSSCRERWSRSTAPCACSRRASRWSPRRRR